MIGLGLSLPQVVARGVPALAGTPSIVLDNTTVTSAWGTVAVGNIIVSNVPAGSYYVRLRDENAGFAIVEG